MSDNDKNEETDYDEDEEIDANNTVAFNVVVDLKHTSLHVTNNSVNGDESIYNDKEDKEVSLDELQEMYNLIYTKWVYLVNISKTFKKDLRDVQTQNESLEQRNHELIAQIKDVTERLNLVESRITRLNIGKEKHDEILQARKLIGLKIGLRCIAEKLNPSNIKEYVGEKHNSINVILAT